MRNLGKLYILEQKQRTAMEDIIWHYPESPKEAAQLLEKDGAFLHGEETGF
jgi:uncharacterized protein (DUF427 family)